MGTTIAGSRVMVDHTRRWVGFLLLPLLLAGCGSDGEFTSDVADVAGNYTIAVTNGPSSCSFEWEEGKESTGIEFAITQEGDNLHATLGGVASALFTLLFGSADFDGTVQGNKLELINYGERTAQQGNCSFTYNSTVTATQTGDTIMGTLTYATKTNENPDCAAVECAASQRFSGNRPPK